MFTKDYIPQHLNIYSITHLEQTLMYTHHKGVMINLGDREVKRNSPHWKFNDSLLKSQQFLEVVKQIIRHTSQNINGNINTKLDNLRTSIQQISRSFISGVIFFKTV